MRINFLRIMSEVTGVLPSFRINVESQVRAGDWRNPDLGDRVRCVQSCRIAWLKIADMM
jgi:hypothetical protein